MMLFSYWANLGGYFHRVAVDFFKQTEPTGKKNQKTSEKS